MKKSIITCWLIAGALSFSACDSGKTNQQNEAAETTATTEAAADTTLSENQQELFTFAAENSMLQVALGKLAVEKGTTEDVKQQGQQLMTWYSDKQKELQELAQEYGITLPQQPGEEGQKKLEDLRGTATDKFDKAYWKNVADMQEEAIQKYDENLEDVTEANPNSFSLWARATMKELQAQRDKTAALRTELKMDNDL